MRTHHEGCWRAPGHHDCAIAMIESLLIENDSWERAVTEARGEAHEARGNVRKLQEAIMQLEKWTAFALEAEYEDFGPGRIVKAHNARLADLTRQLAEWESRAGTYMDERDRALAQLAERTRERDDLQRERDIFSAQLRAPVSPGAVQRLGAHLATRLDEDQWNNVEGLLNEAQATMESAESENRALRSALQELRIRLHVSGRRPEECYEMSIIDAALAAEKGEQT